MSFLFFINQFIVLYQLKILTRYMSAKNLKFLPYQLNLKCSLRQINPALLVVILCVTEVKKLIIFLRETGSGTVDFLIRIKHKTLKHMQHVLLRDQFSLKTFLWVCSSCAVTLFGSSISILVGLPRWRCLFYIFQSIYCHFPFLKSYSCIIW